MGNLAKCARFIAMHIAELWNFVAPCKGRVEVIVSSTAGNDLFATSPVIIPRVSSNLPQVKFKADPRANELTELKRAITKMSLLPIGSS